MKIAIVYHEPNLQRPDSKDVLDEIRILGEALGELGHAHRALAVGGQAGAGLELLRAVEAYQPDLVWNLVEDWGSDPRRQALAPALFEAAGWAYTGSSFQAILNATDKGVTKAVLTANGIPTPAWQMYHGHGLELTVPAPWMVKPAWEDASVGIDEQSVVRDLARMPALLASKYELHHGQPLLIETYIEGREFNLSLCEHPDGRVEAFPPSEIVFTDWPAGKPRILDYRAKWETETFEYRHTVRSFEVEPGLAAELRRLGLETWRAFGLGGYARVDFRRHPSQGLFVIEVNPNPCIAPDAGFMESAQQAGLGSAAVMRLILETALGARGKAGVP